MSQSKIEFRLGAIRFVGEGEKEWVTKQLDKIINRAPSLLRVAKGGKEIIATDVVATSSKKESRPAKRAGNRAKQSTAKAPAPKVSGVKSSTSSKDLAAFIQSKKAGGNQRAKFLAAALWLNKNGKSNPVTRDVTDALKAARVPSLINPSQYLNQNVKQGYLRKAGDGFLITKKGESAL
jgi:hypothetical protein